MQFCNHFLLSDEFFAFLAKTGLTPTETRVLSQMLRYAECENWIRVSQTTIAEDLQLKIQNVQKAVKTLLEKEIILIQPSLQDRRRKDYRLNPCYGWRGTLKSWQNWLQEAGIQEKPKSPAHDNPTKNNVIHIREVAAPHAQRG